MKQYLYGLITLFACVSSSALYAAAAEEKRLCVETMKYTVNVPFTNITTIAQVKAFLHESEGLPVALQVLSKKEWVRKGVILPGQVSITLEDDQTCAFYDLQDNSKVQLSLQLRPR